MSKSAGVSLSLSQLLKFNCLFWLLSSQNPWPPPPGTCLHLMMTPSKPLDVVPKTFFIPSVMNIYLLPNWKCIQEQRQFLLHWMASFPLFFFGLFRPWFRHNQLSVRPDTLGNVRKVLLLLSEIIVKSGTVFSSKIKRIYIGFFITFSSIPVTFLSWKEHNFK